MGANRRRCTGRNFRPVPRRPLDLSNTERMEPLDQARIRRARGGLGRRLPHPTRIVDSGRRRRLPHPTLLVARHGRRSPSPLQQKRYQLHQKKAAMAAARSNQWRGRQFQHHWCIETVMCINDSPLTLFRRQSLVGAFEIYMVEAFVSTVAAFCVSLPPVEPFYIAG